MKGIGVSPGIAIGQAYWLRKQKAQVSGRLLADAAEVRREITAYQKSVQAAMDDLETLRKKLEKPEAEILEIQIQLLQDPAWEDAVLQRISEEKRPAQDAVLLTMEQFEQMFQQMEDAYMQGRAADIRDIGYRLLQSTPALPPGEAWIILAEDLTPSDTLSLDPQGFITQTGGKTSHAAIVARLRGLPAITGVGEELTTIGTGDKLIIDGESGFIHKNPSPELTEQYEQKREAYLHRRQLLQSLKDTPAITRDKIKVHLLANIATAEDMDQALTFGAEGVGLLRTELLFMHHPRLPTENEQFDFYKNILLRSAGRPVTIRTLDIGGDKPLPYLDLPKEENPFLGYRAIRICLDKKDIFITQLRAILRAGLFGNCRIMFPMIASVEELKAAKEIVTQAKAELTTEGIAFAPNVPVGVMIEIPSAALTADLLAKEADFFSIGTNDLCQYTLAVDRMNQQIAALYDPFHPAVLRLIRMVIEEGRRAGISVGMCGEMAGDTKATELLFNMGLREFSMNAPFIPEVKEVIIRL